MKALKFSILFIVIVVVYHLVVNKGIFKDQRAKDTPRVGFLAINKASYDAEGSSSKWKFGSKVGIYAWRKSSLSQATVDSKLYNMPFSFDGKKLFTSPTINSGDLQNPINLIAYYPYSTQADLKDFIFPINISNQQNMSSQELFYGKNANAEGQSIITLNPQLAKFKLVLSANQIDLSKIKVQLNNVLTKADFNLVKGTFLLDYKSAKTISIPVKEADGSYFIEAFILPNEAQGSLKVTLILPDGQSYNWSTPKEWVWESGKAYSKQLALNGDKNPSDSSERVTPAVKKGGYWEMPSIGELSSEEMVVMHMVPSDVKQRNYTMLYDTKMKFAHWVAYPHHKYYLGNTKRTNAWQYDPKVRRKDQVNLIRSYQEKFDRGHQIPSGDRTKTKALNATTFYYTNMAPQEGPGLNQSVWAKLESQVRTWTENLNDTLYVVTGVGVYNENKVRYAHSKSGEKAAIPDYFYKVLLKEQDNKYHTIGYFFENKKSGKDFRKYQKSVREIEEITGFTFFPNLTDESVKDRVDAAYWR